MKLKRRPGPILGSIEPWLDWQKRSIRSARDTVKRLKIEKCNIHNINYNSIIHFSVQQTTSIDGDILTLLNCHTPEEFQRNGYTKALMFVFTAECFATSNADCAISALTLQ